MELTAVGWILIPLGLISFAFRPKWLLFLAIFFVPFSATAIINRGTGDTASGFSPYLYFGSLFVARRMVDATVGMKIRVPRSIEGPLIKLLLFAFVCLASLVMPAVIGGRLYIMSSPNADYSLVPLQYSPQVIAHALSLVFEVLMVVLIAKLGTEPKFFLALVKTYLLSGVFVSLWAWMQFSFYLVGVPYPSQVFNNNASPYASGYGSVLDTFDILRVSSVALEPSFLARVLIAMSAMCLAAVYSKSYIFGKAADTAILILFILTTIITTASTGYFGLAVMPAVLLFLPAPRKGRKIISVAVVLTILCAICVAYFSVPAVADILDSIVFSKAGSGSVLERQLIISNDLQYFLRYPILGIGWDCAPTHDVVIGILTHCGVLGLSAFILLIGSIAWRLTKSSSAAVRLASQSNPAALMLLSLISTCAVYAVSGGIETPDFWVTLGLSIAATGIGCRATSRERAERHIRFGFLRYSSSPRGIQGAAS
jgi:O-Antigen ligase